MKDIAFVLERKKTLSLIFRYQLRAKIATEKIRKHLKSPIRLIDFGCAEGLTLLQMHNLLGTGEYIGIEYSEKLLSFAPRMPYNVKLKNGDITSLPDTIKENYYNVVTALAVFEHLENPLLAMKEAYRVLKNGGLFIATCPDPLWDKISSKLGLLKCKDHVTEMTKTEFIKLFKLTGFNILEYKKFMFAPVGFLPYLKIPVNIRLATSIDKNLSQLKIFNWLFVNQCIVGRK